MSYINEAKALKEKMISHRRYFHQNPELHLDMPLTSSYVLKTLKELGYEPEVVGTSGVIVIAGGRKPGKTFLLRADMDALPMKEESGVDFHSANENMHACGHDLHTAMLLGAAEILKSHEEDIHGQVKLMFQPAEETLSGAVMMIKNGVLENPKVDAAMMMHVRPATELPVGSVITLTPEIAYSASDWFCVTVKGTGCHGAMPELGVDPINILTHIHTALQSINAREVSPAEMITLTIGQIHSGTASNIIPDNGYLTGTIRTTDPKVRQLAKKRLVEIAQGTAAMFRGEAQVAFDVECPAMAIDKDLNNRVSRYCSDLLGSDMVKSIADMPFAKTALGSEDFSCISELVSSTCINLAAGRPEDGFNHSIHHPEVRFDEEALPYGAAVAVNGALSWLAEEAGE